MVLKAGNMVGVYLRPHDLRRHAATYASRSGVPIEIISKIILRHANMLVFIADISKGVCLGVSLHLEIAYHPTK